MKKSELKLLNKFSSRGVFERYLELVFNEKSPPGRRFNVTNTAQNIGKGITMGVHENLKLKGNILVITFLCSGLRERALLDEYANLIASQTGIKYGSISDELVDAYSELSKDIHGAPWSSDALVIDAGLSQKTSEIVKICARLLGVL